MDQVSANTRRLAEKSAAQAKRTAEHSALTAFNGVREFYVKMLEMAQENTVAGFDVARELATVQSPSELVEVWNARAREAYDTFSQQAKELSDLAQKAATSTPLTNGLTNPFRQAQ